MMHPARFARKGLKLLYDFDRRAQEIECTDELGEVADRIAGLLRHYLTLAGSLVDGRVEMSKTDYYAKGEKELGRGAVLSLLLTLAGLTFYEAALGGQLLALDRVLFMMEGSIFGAVIFYLIAAPHNLNWLERRNPILQQLHADPGKLNELFNRLAAEYVEAAKKLETDDEWVNEEAPPDELAPEKEDTVPPHREREELEQEKTKPAQNGRNEKLSEDGPEPHRTNKSKDHAALAKASKDAPEENEKSNKEKRKHNPTGSRSGATPTRGHHPSHQGKDGFLKVLKAIFARTPKSRTAIKPSKGLASTRREKSPKNALPLSDAETSSTLEVAAGRHEAPLVTQKDELEPTPETGKKKGPFPKANVLAEKLGSSRHNSNRESGKPGLLPAKKKGKNAKKFRMALSRNGRLARSSKFWGLTDEEKRIRQRLFALRQSSHDEKKQAAEKQKPTPEHGDDVKKILHIHDNAQLRDEVRKILCDRYTILSAIGGFMGVKKARIERPDVIVIDAELRGKDGYAVCADLRQDQDTYLHNVPIVILAKTVNQQDLLKAGASGVADIIKTKTNDNKELEVEPEILLSRLEATLAGQKNDLAQLSESSPEDSSDSDPAAAGNPSSPEASKPLVILISKDAVLGKALPTILEERGFSATVINEMKQSLNSITAQRPEVVILDDDFPRIGSHVIGRHINMNLPRARVILLISNLANHRIKEIKLHGIIRKAKTHAELAGMLEQLLESTMKTITPGNKETEDGRIEQSEKQGETREA